MIGDLHNERAEYLKVLNCYDQALSIRRSIGGTSGEAATLQSKGYTHDMLGEKEKALDCYNQALQLVRAAGNQSSEGALLHAIAVEHYELGQVEKALDLLDQALSVRRLSGDRAGEATTLSYIGGIIDERGQGEKALEYLERGLQLFRDIGDRRGEASVLTNIAATLSSSDDHYKALRYHRRALTLRHAIGDRKEEAVALTNVGVAYARLGDFDQGLEYLERALNLSGDGDGGLHLLHSLAYVHSVRGQHQIALDYLNRALIVSRTLKDRRTEAHALDGISAIYYRRGDMRKAVEYCLAALHLFQELGDRAGQAGTLANIGKACALLGDRLKAFDYYNQALDLATRLGDRSLEAGVLVEIAGHEREGGNPLASRSKIERALAIIEGQRSKVASPELRTFFLGSVHHYYEVYIDLLMRLHKDRPKEGYDAAALQASERGRARSMLELLSEARADIRQGIDASLLQSERTLQNLLDAKAERQIRLLGGEHTDKQAAVAGKEVEEVQTKLEEVQALIRAKSPHYAALTQPVPLSLKEIQQQVLDEGTLLLEYALGDERSYLFAVTPTSFTSYKLAKRTDLENAARRVTELLKAREFIEFDEPREKAARVKKADAEYSEAAFRLSEMILGPAAVQLSKKRLLIVADGALLYVPFGALPIPKRPRMGGDAGRHSEGQTGDYASTYTPLILLHEIVTIPSASTLAVLRREVAGRKLAPKAVAVLADPVFEKDDERVKALVRGPTGEMRPGPEKKDNSTKQATPDITQAETAAPPDLSIAEYQLQRSARESGVMKFTRLPFTRGEADGIAALVPPGKGKKALDFAASRATATSPDLSQYRLVHFATHGLLNSEHPELSGIVLSLVDEQGKPQDGFLRLHDLYNLNLSADVVVLSACKTGLGKDIRGEGLVGLTRGFIYAGAKSVVASLWDVNDKATAELMVRFYRGMLVSKLRPAAALRTAQVSMLKEQRWGSPYYWAAFQLQGEWK